MQRGLGAVVRAIVRTAFPSLRVVALVYTGLSAIALLVVVVTAALAPRAPVVQQVTEPARQAVTTLVQPTGNVITTLVSAPAPAPASVAFSTAPAPTPFVDTATLDVTIDDVPALAPEPEVVAVASRPQRAVLAPPAAAVEDVSSSSTSDEDTSAEDLAIEDDAAPATPDAIVEPAEPSVVMASVEAPKALPTVTPVPLPETPAQAKARMDAANQAAIDAAKTAAAQARAKADAANQAAIDAAKAPVMADSALALPGVKADPKLAEAKAKAEADAANQAAIDAAKAATKPKK